MEKDYSVYKMNKTELRNYLICGGIALCIAGYLFYRNLIVCIILSCLLIPLKSVWEEILKQKRTDRMLAEFKDALYFISASLASGKQLEASVNSASQQISAAYGSGSDLSEEFDMICRRNEDSHEDMIFMFADLGRRTGIREISCFASACDICRKCGADMEKVTVKNASVIIEKLEFLHETESLAKEKRDEIVLLSAMPFGILLFFNIFADDYLSPLYNCTAGRLLMTLCLVLIAAALLWCVKLLDIHV